MFFQRFYDTKLAQASYLIGCQRTGEAVVVDPNRDVEQYVAAATRAYRRAVDDAWDQRPLSLTPLDELQLDQIYSRGAGPYFVTGTNHQQVVRGRAPRHRGLLMGSVDQILPAAIVLRPSTAHSLSPLKPGDGVVFDAADWRSPADPEEGGRLYEVTTLPSGFMNLAFAGGALRPARIRPGDLLWRTDDPALEKLLKPVTQPTAPLHKQQLHVLAEAAPDQPLRLTFSLVIHPEISVAVTSPDPLPPALNRSLDLPALRAQLDRLGPTPYSLGPVELLMSEPVFAPASLLNQLRRDAVDLLQQRQSRPRAVSVADPILSPPTMTSSASSHHIPANPEARTP